MFVLVPDQFIAAGRYHLCRQVTKPDSGLPARLVICRLEAPPIRGLDPLRHIQTHASCNRNFDYLARFNLHNLLGDDLSCPVFILMPYQLIGACRHFLGCNTLALKLVENLARLDIG